MKDPQQSQEKDPPLPQGRAPVPPGPLDLAVLVLALGQQDRARGAGQVSSAAALPVAAPWAAAWMLLLVLPPAHEDDAVPLSGCCKVGKSMFWGHALGQATPGCPCRLLLARGTALAGTVCFLQLLGLCPASLGIHLGQMSWLKELYPRPPTAGRWWGWSSRQVSLPTALPDEAQPQPREAWGCSAPLSQAGLLRGPPSLSPAPGASSAHPQPTQGQRQDGQRQAASTGCCALQGPRCQLAGPKRIPEEGGSQI